MGYHHRNVTSLFSQCKIGYTRHYSNYKKTTIHENMLEWRKNVVTFMQFSIHSPKHFQFVSNYLSITSLMDKSPGKVLQSVIPSLPAILLVDLLDDSLGRQVVSDLKWNSIRNCDLWNMSLDPFVKIYNCFWRAARWHKFHYLQFNQPTDRPAFSQNNKPTKGPANKSDRFVEDKRWNHKSTEGLVFVSQESSKCRF